MDKSPHSNLHVYRNFWGKLRKSAVRSHPTAAVKPNNSEDEGDDFDGKIKKRLQCEDGCQMGKNILGSKREIKKAHMVFDEMPKKEKTEENNFVSTDFGKDYSGAMKGTVTKLVSKTNGGIDIGTERRSLLNLFRKECKNHRKQKCRKRVDIAAYDALLKTGDMFDKQKFIGPPPGVLPGEKFEYRLELVIMGIHTQPQKGIDYMEKQDGPEGRVLAISIVANEVYGDNLRNPNELIYTGEGGGTFQASKSKGGVKDQELERGNLALKNSANTGNVVRVVRGITSSRYAATVFVYDGLYIVDGYAKELGSNGKMKFKFTLK
ncbi:hypothetical protein SOVF_014570, partial [Spinacia oleracea]